MPGSKARLRQHISAKLAAKMHAEGYTYKEIAERTGLKPEALKSRILLGERLLSVEAIK